MPDIRAHPSIALPDSYASLPFTQIKLSHHPASSTEVTPIIILTLYRPKNYNAFTPIMRDEIVQAYKYFDADQRVKCIVFTGHGRMFCAGADLDAGFSKTGRAADHRDGGGQTALAIHHCQKPTIGAMQGPAVGVGVTMTLPMSIRVALKSAKMGLVFARRGIVMEAASSFFLPRLIGYSRALHLVTTGGVYRADDKLFDGLFTELCDTPEEVLQKALGIAEEVARNTSSVSTYLQREMMWRDMGSAEGQHLLDSRILYDLFGSEDNDEGVKSFMEKRQAKYQGTMESNAPQVYPWWSPIDVFSKAKATKQLGKAKL
ncbi:enoyl-CoA hydratase/isomeras-like protein [Pseudovirgaria hyperparasitica]|uniref:Enoyl-CoA hydratase/isomeras-like protein n=1 Tax=Pseudovirgaria hyperparasitica TaxID=470096 RepID=A0A6A6WAT9_9PEZI|nr:enoyl-CoA hydratase/isomeras-like protein [Pseudovirgaria hyperparasitica]KAF2758707.1 enoyl-CoA hydratase/isomeras-like protein [Pseudovirgaria hyperparasitica]